jgi:hypothetical protein
MKLAISVFFACFLLGLLVLWPLLNSGLRTDDWGWLALAHMLENPFASYGENILWGYFYRPSTMVLWWLSERLVGDNATGHYLINIALHSASAGCLVLLLRAAGRPNWVSLLIGFAFVCSPAIAGTSMWLSSRNEMLGILCGLSCMLVLEREINRQQFRGITIAILVFVAATAKESAYLFPVACALRVFLDNDLRQTLDKQKTIRIFLFLFAPLMLAAILRSLTIVPIGPEANPASLFETMRTGILHWLLLWPSAISGFEPRHIYWIYFAATAICALFALTAFRNDGRTRAWAISALLLATAPAALQAPITATILNQVIAINFPENLRFFATSSLGMLLLIGMCMPVARLKFLSIPALSTLVIAGGLTTFHLASTWRKNTLNDDGQARQLAVIIPARMASIQCGVLDRIIIDAPVSPSLAPWIDPVLKAQWPRNANIQHCSFFVKSQESYYQILPKGQCDTSRWGAKTSAQFLSKAWLLPLDSVCQTSMVQPSTDNATAVIQIQGFGR